MASEAGLLCGDAGTLLWSLLSEEEEARRGCEEDGLTFSVEELFLLRMTAVAELAPVRASLEDRVLDLASASWIRLEILDGWRILFTSVKK